MDGLKLEIWKQNFNQEVQHLDAVLNTSLDNKNLNQLYEIIDDEVNQSLSLVFTEDTLTEDIKQRLLKLFESTKPEDSV